jgi:hypothetical protein
MPLIIALNDELAPVSAFRTMRGLLTSSCIRLVHPTIGGSYALESKDKL